MACIHHIQALTALCLLLRILGGVAHPLTMSSAMMRVERMPDVPRDKGAQLHGPASTFNGSNGAETPLTSFGNGLRTVVFAAVTYEGVCSPSRHGGMDWRGSLPRFIARRLRPRAEVLVWNGRGSARSDMADTDCEACIGNDTDLHGPRETFGCSEWFHRRHSHQQKHADLVVVIGTGAEKCSECKSAIKVAGSFGELKLVKTQPWVGPQTVILHIPISRDDRVLENRVAGFNAIVQDGSWIKPVNIETSGNWRAACYSKQKRDTLVYVARYHEWKGQLKFLSLVDPSQLKGFTLEFFSGNSKKSFQDEMQKIATERGIDVIIHGNPANRTELMSAICSAKGAIHYAKTDANPRVLYEFLMAQLPVLITKESRVPRTVLKQPFVEGVKFGDKNELKRSLGHLMEKIKDPVVSKAAREDISSFIAKELDEDVALAKVCTLMGICNATKPSLEAHHRPAGSSAAQL